MAKHKLIEKLKKAADWFNANFRIRWWSLVFIYGIIIIWLSSLPHPPTLETLTGFQFSNAVNHVVLYLGFGLVLGIAFRHSDKKVFRDNSYLWAIVFGVLFALFDEFFQGFTPNRYFDFLDIAADSFGLMIAQAFRWFIKLEKNILHKLI
ncbi:VanZ family protein [Candidatus Woesearchaeota archaeon]|nr:VanZ family protein [Candidatus Woesearchaeota archaeon]